MSRVILNHLHFHASQLFIGLTRCNIDLMFLTLGKKSLFNIEGFFNIIFRRETSTALKPKSQKQISDNCLFFFYLLLAETFFCLRPTTIHFKFSFQQCSMSRGILSLIHHKLAWELEVLGARSGSLFEILVAHRHIIGASCTFGSSLASTCLASIFYVYVFMQVFDMNHTISLQ